MTPEAGAAGIAETGSGSLPRDAPAAPVAQTIGAGEWSALFEAHPLPHFVYDIPSLRLLFCNAAAVRRYGYTRDELLALTCADLLLPSEVPELRARLAAMPSGAAQASTRGWFERRRDGRVLHAEVSGMPIAFTGRPARLAVVIDSGESPRPGSASAESSQAALLLQESREQTAALLAAIPDLWLVTDAEHRVIEVSDPLHALLGANAQNWLGRPVDEDLDAVPARRLRWLLGKAQTSGEPQRFGYQATVRNGERRSLEARCVALKGGRSMLLIRDVTDAAQHERLFQTMVDVSPNGIFLCDAAGALSYANAAWQALFNLPLEASLGHGWADGIRPEDRRRVEEAWAHAMQDVSRTGAWEMEFRVGAADGAPRTVAVRSRPLLSPAGQVEGHVGSVVDVTQARELERARRAQAVAEEAERRQSEFMSRVSHELRTPLNAILGFGQLLLQGDAPPDSRTRRYASHVVTAGQHMLALVDDLLRLQRLEHGKVELMPAPIDVAALLSACADLLRPLADGAGVELLLAAPDGLQLTSDERCLRQVLLNLGSNAIKYGRTGDPALTSTVLMAATATDGSIELSVSDAGRGITAAEMQRLFKPFERLGQESGGQPGSGLGLVITRQLAHLLGGDVSLVSESGRGTTATLRLPR